MAQNVEHFGRPRKAETNRNGNSGCVCVCITSLFVCVSSKREYKDNNNGDIEMFLIKTGLKKNYFSSIKL